MHEDGSLDLARIPQIVEHLVNDRVAGLYVNGTTGEGPSLTGGERRAAAEAYVRAAGRRLPVIVQVGHNSLFEARELAAHAQAIGADAVSATPPMYFRPAGVGELVTCMADVASAAPDLLFFYYHIPRMTRVELDMVEFLQRAAERIPNFAGIKFSCSNLHEFQACVEFAADRWAVFFGYDEMLLSALVVGARAAVGSTYNFAAPLYHRLIEAFERGNLPEARRLQGLSVAMVRVLLHYRGMAGLKAAMKLVGRDCGPTRRPLIALTDAELEAMRRELQSIGFFDFVRA